MKKIALYLISFFIVFNFASCKAVQSQTNYEDNQNEVSRETKVHDNSLAEEENVEVELKVKYEKYTKYDFEEFELYDAANIDKDIYDIKIHDADNDNILFSTVTDREDREKYAIGILSTTKQLYLYNSKKNKVELLGEFDNFYIINAYICNDKYMVSGVNLGVEDGMRDKSYSILYGEKNKLEEVHRAWSSFSLIFWPELIKLSTGIVLLEPEEQEPDASFDSQKKPNLYKFCNGKFIKTDYKLPNNFSILQTKTKSTGNIFVNFWENMKEKQAYFIIMDENGVKNIIPFSKEHRLNDFTIKDKKLFVSVQNPDNTKSRLLIIDIETGKTNSVIFDNIYKMTSLSGRNTFIGKIISMEYLVEVTDNEIIVTMIDTILLPEDPGLFYEYKGKTLIAGIGEKKFFLLDSR